MTTFKVPINNVRSTLQSAHTSGNTSLNVAAGTGTLFGSTFPLRVTVITAASYLSTTESLTIFSVTARSTDTLTVSAPIEGTSDQNYAIGDVVEMRSTAGSFSDIHTAVNTLELGTAPGSSGQLVYNSSNVFAGASDWSVGASGQLVGTPISAPTPAIGNLWFDSARDTYGFVGGNSAACLPQSIGGAIWQAIPSGNTAFTAATNSNATSLFSLLQAGTTIGSLTFPANSLTSGKIIRIHIGGVLAIPAAPPTITFQITLGGNVIWGVSNLAPAQITSATSWAIGFQGPQILQVQSVGATGKIIGFIGCNFGSGSSVTGYISGTSSSLGTVQYVAPVALTIDTTTSLALDVQVKFNTAVAGSSMQLTYGWVELCG